MVLPAPPLPWVPAHTQGLCRHMHLPCWGRGTVLSYTLQLLGQLFTVPLPGHPELKGPSGPHFGLCPQTRRGVRRSCGPKAAYNQTGCPLPLPLEGKWPLCDFQLLEASGAGRGGGAKVLCIPSPPPPPPTHLSWDSQESGSRAISLRRSSSGTFLSRA